MKRITLLFTFLLIVNISWAQAQKGIGNLIVEGIPDIPDTLIERMNQYQNTRAANLEDWSPDGKSMLISTRFGDTYQLHVLDHPGGARKQVTFFKEPVSAAVFNPQGSQQRLMFTKDTGGNEFRQLYEFDLVTGKYEMISGGGRSQNTLPRWSNKGDRFISVSTKRNGKDYDLYLHNVNNLKVPKCILQEGGLWGPLDWSPDDKYLLVSNYISANKAFIHKLDLGTGTLEQLNATNEDVAYGGGFWSADGKGVFLVNDQGTEFLTLKYYDLSSKKVTDLTSSIPWSIDAMDISKDRSRIIFSVNENGTSKVYYLLTDTRKITPVNGLPAGVISGLRFNPQTQEIGMTINAPRSPGDVYSYHTGTGKLARWTYSEVGGLNNSAFTEPRLIEYETFDDVGGKRRKIPAFYYKPENAQNKLPVLINIHGGPEGQFRPLFSSFISYMTNELGIAVVSPNVRGSTGYGKTYLKLDNGYSREESVKDIGALLDWIATQPELDASRVAVYGGSYGGYMVLASMVHYNDRLKCGIDVVGISNFVTFLENTEDYRKDLRRVEYGDERDPTMKDFLNSISPANHVGKITRPMFIIQGLNDPRVPASESEQMKQKLLDKGGDVWYLLAKDEGHGFRKKTNSDYLQWSVVLFLQEKLLK